MSNQNNGGQAFPQPVAYTPLGREVPSYPGMTLRDYFAAKAMQGLLAANATYSGKTNDRAALSADAYGHADAMLAAREAV